MDKADCNILAWLQRDGRLSLTELAERVGISLSSCQRRVRALEHEGVISGYRAHLDPARFGLNFSAIVFVTLREGDRQAVAAFEAAVEEIPQIIQAQRLFGDPDYLLHVITRDLPAFQELYDEKLSGISGVQRLTSTLVMKTVVKDRALPV
ncbi:TPA: Lrp/AsnC family transcriptional regulator [Escherichia coli]|uniref:Lrp/AsnC family transcriptional regulator n=1 Tax=Escherichia coli TaxID=562 RepID=UPI000BE5521B|nr:Lrp/AsnC family transcriptional regulator [Escherichia coli]EIP7099219.1 Lrp/AsnC family transcriptional regulator [Escherichia coli]HAZ3561122.1 Lrp/AsnC family transcriptional regulator [Escherichia coli]HAZ3564848.1 Lrp/AsnC family transcriptional regulator [Escherichia coli]HBA8808828.1 Lrp/AsnC family transcriptional regulator [Escherichia coli]HBI7651091.1 Lrp/AsnC family transcriptional regulator [Escherichia coli]